MSAAARRAIGALLVAGVVLAGAADRLRPAHAPAAPSVRPPATGGVWACPVVAPGRYAAWLNLFNPSESKSTARIRWVRPPAKPVLETVSVAPGSVVTIPGPASTPASGAGAIVEWGGGELVASRGGLFRTLAKRTIAIGGSCSKPGDAMLAIPGLSTLGADAQIVMLNPSTADALVDVSFLSGGDEITPENARARVVPSGGRLIMRVNDFVFDRQPVGALIRVSTGTVAADGVVTSASSGSLIPGSAPVTSGVAAAYAFKAARLQMVAIGDEPATVDATTITPRTRGATTGFPPGLEPFAPVSVGFPTAAGPLGVSLDDREGSPIAAALTFTLPGVGTDSAVVPVQRPTARWLGVIGGPAARGRDARLSIVNAGDRPAVLTVRLFTGKGEQPAGPLATLTLPAGRAASYVLDTLGAAPFGVEIVSDGAPIAASLLGRPGSGRNAVLFASGGFPTEPPRPVPLRIDPRTGVDAP